MAVADPEVADIVYVLGAGTSVSAGLPTIAQFQQAAALAPQDIKKDAAKERFLKTLNDWTAMPGMNVEEYFTLTELEDRLEGAGRTGARTRDARYLIAKTLHAAWWRQSKSITQADFAARICERNKSGHLQEAIITLNWDFVFEDATASMRHMALDYGLENSEVPDPKAKDPDAFQLPFLKLHGSLNWLSCSSCGKVQVVRSNHVIDNYEGDPTPCSCSSGAVEPLIVPPTSQKFDEIYGAKSLAPVWRRARKLLGSCSYLALVGYSMPPTDVQFRTFLIDALRRNPYRVRTTVVSNPKFGSARLEFEDRYSAALSLPNVDLEFVSMNFGDHPPTEALFTIPYLGRYHQNYMENLRAKKE